MVFSCSKPENKEPDYGFPIQNSMVDINDNPAYSKVGLLKLSDYGFFQQPMRALNPVSDLLPYDLNTPLFTDYASKSRFLYIPEGSTIVYREKEVLDFPEGTILIKNFFYDASQLKNAPEKIIETRLLIKNNEGWVALPYIWNEAQTEAYLEITGGTVPVQLEKKDHPFEYRIPSMLQCKSCHELNAEIIPIGPTARQLNKVYPYAKGTNNQLKEMIELGWLTNHPEQGNWPVMPQWDNPSSGSLNARARAYLDINCGHCHRPGGPGKNSGLDLTVFASSEHSLGVGKSPVAAGAGSGGLRYDIVPGEPDRSILTFRMRSNNPGIMMPELGRSLIHEEGIDLIEEWIKSMN
jgi:uncharacterized repeat protein (TIGR03806 family)